MLSLDVLVNCSGSVSTKKPDSPFAALEQLRGSLPEGPARSGPLGHGVGPAGTPPAAKPAPAPKRPARAVIRLERKQRGGKEVTVIEKLELPARELETWCRELKQALGCGGAVEGATIVLQGNLKQRLPAILSARGVHKVVVG